MSILGVENLSKSFGGLMAISNLDFALEEGKILGLIGPNGSGKTTLFNLITGFLKPDTGRITFDGREITGLAPFKVCSAGIARTFQLNKPFGSMTALENVMVGRIYGNEAARSVEQAITESESILSLTGLYKKRLMRPAAMGVVDRKRLEVARALATKPRILLIDEMMAGLNSREIEDAMQFLEGVRNSGITLLVVEHVMKAILGISDSVMVLCAGKKIAEGTPQDIVQNKQVLEAYLGEENGAGS